MQLGRVLNRATVFDIGSLSRHPSGDLEDGLRTSRERIGVATAGSTTLDIVLELIEHRDQPSIWLFSSQTLAVIPELAEQVEGSWQERYLPRVLVEREFLSIELYRWIALPAVITLLFAATRLLTWLLSLLLNSLVHRFSDQHDDRKISISSGGPIWLLTFSIALHVAAKFGPTALARHRWDTVSVILIVISVAWLLIRLTRITTNLTARRMRRLQAPEKIALANLTGRLAQILVGLSALLIVLGILGVDLTGILAGLGLGGVALAFGAQKTLENFLGGVMIISDASIRVGDECRVGEHFGVIEDIGLRSTRMRAIDRSLVYIPNAQLSVMSLENRTERDKILFQHVVGLRRETTSDQLRSVLNRTHQMLLEHRRVEPTSARVRFTGVGESSLNIEVFAFVAETTMPAFLEVQQELLLETISIIEACGARLSMPSQINYETIEAPPRAAKDDTTSPDGVSVGTERPVLGATDDGRR
jgi:MscS family membrane protein